MTLLILPIIIVAAQKAIRTVPDSTAGLVRAGGDASVNDAASSPARRLWEIHVPKDDQPDD